MTVHNARSLMHVNYFTRVFKKYVQFKIVHHILNTRQLLFKMNITETDKCFYCKNTIDSTFHALIACPPTAHLWSQVEIWLRKKRRYLDILKRT